MFGSSSTSLIIFVVLIVAVVVFIVISVITGKKTAKKEKAQRYKSVRNELKKYLAQNEKKKNVRVEFLKVYSRRGPEYKYRDVFDVVVELIEPKTQKVIEKRAYEVEGITEKIEKNKYNTSWIVNCRLNLEESEKRIALGQKEIKLTKEEKKVLKRSDREKEKELAILEKEEIKRLRSEAKKNKLAPERKKTTDVLPEQKFIPGRKKESK